MAPLVGDIKAVRKDWCVPGVIDGEAGHRLSGQAAGWEMVMESVQVQTLMLMAAVLRANTALSAPAAVDEALVIYHQMLASISDDRDRTISRLDLLSRAGVAARV